MPEKLKQWRKRDMDTGDEEDEGSMTCETETQKMEPESLDRAENQVCDDTEDSPSEVDWKKLNIQPNLKPSFESFKGKSIVIGDIPDVNYDWTPYFKTNTVFKSLDELKNWLKEFGKTNKMVIVIKKSDFKGRNPRIVFACEKSGTYKPMKNPKPLLGAETKRHTGTKKCDCPFSFTTYRHPIGENQWVIKSIHCGKHNRPLSPYIEGHAYHARLTDEEKMYFADLSKWGVKPKSALAILKDRNPDNSSSLQTLYNAKNKIIKEEREDRTEFQQLMMLADKAGYVVSNRRDPETDIVMDFSFAHPDSISLAKCFPYLFVMDCTYKTNMHKFPLFEIVGVTSTMMTFSVCYCFLEHKTEDHYRWALERFKGLLFDNQVPLTFVTDRELALMNAIKFVFPQTTQLLCRCHISMGIEKKGKNVLPKKADEEKEKLMHLKDGEERESLNDKWRRMWDAVVYSSNEEDYHANLFLLQQEFIEWLVLYEYACGWLELKEKFVSMWTDQFFHLGNTSSNRVEGAHATLKDSLSRSSRHTFLSMYNLINNSLGIQMSEIKKSFTLSLNNHAHEHRISLFKDMREAVSSACLKLLRKEFDRWASGHGDPEKCGCAITRTHGLPCACMVGTLINENRVLDLRDLHHFWKKLSVEPRRAEIEELEMYEEFQMWVDNFNKSSSDQKKYLLRRLREDCRPQTTWLANPIEPVKGKGRPMKSKAKNDWSTKRDPSSFERDIPAIPTPPSGQFYSLGSGNSNRCANIPPFKKPIKPTDLEEYAMYIPYKYESFVEYIINVDGDGNCGFRAVAMGLGMCPKAGWEQVRKDCVLELDAHVELYSQMFGGKNAVERLRQRINHFESPILKNDHYWLLMPGTGYVIANFYSVVFVYMSKSPDGVSKDLFLTFVPQYKSPPPLVSAQVARIPLISMMYVAEMSHFVCLKLKQYAPISPGTTFSTSSMFRQTNAIEWDEYMQERTTTFQNIFKDKFITNDKTDVIELMLSDSDEET